MEGGISNPEHPATAFENGVDAVIHFAALKVVGKSFEQPLDSFSNNIGGTIALMQAMEQAGVARLVFSSSATVYGQAETVPVKEDAPLQATNPYGRSKLVMEQLVQDWCSSCPSAAAVLLRYFNPVGAHPSGLIGEDPQGEPNNLMPYVAQVAVGRRERLRVYGSDYPTPDGTGVRDYLHVMDLARAHLQAVDYAAAHSGCEAVNLGTGRGYSVLELVQAFEQASGRPIPHEITQRRAGDVAELTAAPALTNQKLGWRANLGIEAMCEDTWHWQNKNPEGYE